ncbi:MAG: Sec-independent protein translocase protein TatB [Accumulibacter sp.]|uniref:Sec-independent protein translocase protein TatB n=1 Tax=Accumulibacter sp. TaxID=2053492 RepID=UPI00121A4798|nr:Sec-independent protein translocase protein TatB [Accumulibacter sp.]TLD44299.1 MAG: Sec-independent protein translocase protein TatB [Accumulibacter sp.]
MFDIGFSELMLIAVVALVVIGPERLPRVARTAGHLLGRLQRYVSTVKSDISREMQLEELRRLQSEIEESARSVEDGLSSEMQAAKQALTATAEAVNREIKAPPASAPAPSLAHSPVAPPLPGDLPGTSASRSGPGTSA